MVVTSVLQQRQFVRCVDKWNGCAENDLCNNVCRVHQLHKVKFLCLCSLLNEAVSDCRRIDWTLVNKDELKGVWKETTVS